MNRSSTVTAQFKTKKCGMYKYLQVIVDEKVYTWKFLLDFFRKSRIKDVMEHLASEALNKALSDRGGNIPVSAYVEQLPIPYSNTVWPERGEDRPSFNISVTIAIENDNWLLVTVNSSTTRTTIDELFVTLESMISNIIGFYL